MKNGPFSFAVPILAALFMASVAPSAQGQIPAATPLLGPAAAPAPDVLTLTCTGGGTAMKTDASLAYGSASAHALRRSETYHGFDGEIELRLFSADDRIRLPPAMLPAGRIAKAEWFRIKKRAVSDHEITGLIETSRIGAYLPNAPKFRIDRDSGAIDILTKSGGFSGACSKSDPLAQKAKF
jgi:hypothetical protein